MARSPKAAVILCIMLVAWMASTWAWAFDGIQDKEARAYALAQKAATASGREKVELLDESIELSPEVPVFHFRRGTAELPNVVGSFEHYAAGVKAYARNFLWSVSLWGLLYMSALGALALSLLVIALMRFFMDLPLILHELNENKAKLILPLIVIALSAISPLFLVAGLLMLSWRYLGGTGKFVAIVSLALIIFSPLVLRTADMFFSSSGAPMRAVAYANENRDASFAIQMLRGGEGFEERFSYALALKQSGRIGEAIDIYREMSEDSPDARLYANLGNAYVAAGRGSQAKEAYQKALALGPSAALLFNLSQVYRDSLDFPTGDKYYDQALRMDTDRVSELTTRAGKSESLYVVDIPLTRAELWAFAQRQAKPLLSLSTLGPVVDSAAAIALFIASIVLDRVFSVRAFRCVDCGKVFCSRCTDPRDNRCKECYVQYKEDSSPQARVRRMIAENERKAKRRSALKVLSFLPPGIAQTYAGGMLEGLIFMWIALFCVLALVLNPLFKAGMAWASHGWMSVPLAAALAVTYAVSIMTANRKAAG